MTMTVACPLSMPRTAATAMVTTMAATAAPRTTPPATSNPHEPVEKSLKNTFLNACPSDANIPSGVAGRPTAASPRM